MGGGSLGTGGGRGWVSWRVEAGLHTSLGSDTGSVGAIPWKKNSTVGKTGVTQMTRLSGSGMLSQLYYSVHGTPTTGGDTSGHTSTFRHLSLIP